MSDVEITAGFGREASDDLAIDGVLKTKSETGGRLARACFTGLCCGELCDQLLR